MLSLILRQSGVLASSRYLYILVSLASFAHHAACQCYGLYGKHAEWESYEPCYSSSGTVACCNTAGGDLCLDTGLCLATQAGYSGRTFAIGCTDSTGASSACSKLCQSVATDDQQTYEILTCDEGPNQKFCCSVYGNQTSCCNDPNLISEDPRGQILLPNTSIPISSFSSLSYSKNTTGAQNVSSSATQNSTIVDDAKCLQDKSAVIGGALGGVLGATLIAALVTIFFLLRTRRHNDTRESTPLNRVAIEERLAELERQLQQNPIISSRDHQPPAQELSARSKYEHAQILDNVAEIRYELGMKDDGR